MIDIATNLVQINQKLFHSFFITIIITKCSFPLAPTKYMCYKIVSKFAPNKNNFVSFFHCSQHVPKKFPMGSHQYTQLFIKGSHNMVIKKVSITIKGGGGGMKKGKNGPSGGGGTENNGGDRKVFNHHRCVATKNLSFSSPPSPQPFSCHNFHM